MSPAATAVRRPVPATQRRAPLGAPARPPLKVVGAGPRRRRSRRRLAPLVSLALLVASLLSVVVGHALLAQGQVRLSAAQAALRAAQAEHRQEALAVAQLETPSRIAREASGTLQMVAPGQVHQLPHVPLNVPLGAPKVSGTAPASPSSSPPTSTPTRGQ